MTGVRSVSFLGCTSDEGSWLKEVVDSDFSDANGRPPNGPSLKERLSYL